MSQRVYGIASDDELAARQDRDWMVSRCRAGGDMVQVIKAPKPKLLTGQEVMEQQFVDHVIGLLNRGKQDE